MMATSCGELPVGTWSTSPEPDSMIHPSSSTYPGVSMTRSYPRTSPSRRPDAGDATQLSSAEPLSPEPATPDDALRRARRSHRLVHAPWEIRDTPPLAAHNRAGFAEMQVMVCAESQDGVPQ